MISADSTSIIQRNLDNESDSFLSSSKHHSNNPHASILITSNADFSSQGFLGTGTSSDPYRIQHFSITDTADDLISIKNTSVHFIISSNLLTGGSSAMCGISLTNVRNAIIEKNVVAECISGLKITNVTNSIFINNSVYDHLTTGVYLKETQNITISNNSIYNHHQGDLFYSNLLLNNCSDSLITNNAIFDGHFGVTLLNQANDNEFSHNSIFNNSLQGVRLDYAHRNTFEFNHLQYNRQYGVLIESGAIENRFTFNNFHQNNLGGHQSKDSGSFNTFEYNHWDDWPVIDSNKDLIIDLQYPLDGNANNTDPYPLVSVTDYLNAPAKANSFFEVLISVLLYLLSLFLPLTLCVTYILYPEKFRLKSALSNIKPPLLLPEFFSHPQIEDLKPIYHKLIVGVENIQNDPHHEPTTIVITKPEDPLDLVEYFPHEIKQDLVSGLKGRTILTLIEIGFQDPKEASLVKLAQSLNIPVSTLSKDIKNLNKLKYVEPFVSSKVLHDARYRNYTITPKGYKFLLTLKEALKITIDKLKVFSEDEIA